MVQEVKYEIAKLLAEKGFPQNNIDYETISTIGKDENDDFIFGNTYSCPTIAQVIMWLCEKYKIWITVYTMDKWMPNGNDREQLFDYGIKQMKLGLIDIPKKPEEFNSPTEAYIAAISNILNNLI